MPSESGQSFRLSVLTWNLAMFERSLDAPTYWGPSDVEATVRDVILDLRPDIVVLQELPGLVPFVETHDMVRSNPRSHSGNLATLVSHDLMASTKPKPTVVPRASLLTTFAPLDLTVANVHLAPGRGSGDERLGQLAAVSAACGTERLVVVGDTNTRLAEDDAIAGLGFTTEAPPSPTWDGHRNRFRGDSGRFRAYFTRAFTRGPVAIEQQRVLNDLAVEVDGSRFHVSDHFALMITVSG
jgi:endonuclease/exonuclease/phosphatase family metal-dependent hydrolase